MHAVAVIPARYASSRFPGKPLAPILGRPMIAWVVRAARQTPSLADVWVATDSELIADAARAAGARVAMTSPDCPTGSDRVAEAATSVDADVYVNLQGDEPLVEPGDIDAIVRVFEEEPGTRISTLAHPISNAVDFADSNLVKVVCDAAGHALYFSRSSIPYYREAWSDADGLRPIPEGAWSPQGHLGIYAFSREALFSFTRLPPGRLEKVEQLEQLRALEAGWKIRVVTARGGAVGVDTPEDLVQVEEALRERIDSGEW